jgi:hypothetical protein
MEMGSKEGAKRKEEWKRRNGREDDKERKKKSCRHTQSSHPSSNKVSTPPKSASRTPLKTLASVEALAKSRVPQHPRHSIALDV